MLYFTLPYNLILSKSFYYLIKDLYPTPHSLHMDSKSKKSAPNSQKIAVVQSKVPIKPTPKTVSSLNNAQQQMVQNTQQLPIQPINGPSLFQAQQGPVSFNQPIQIQQNFVPAQLSNQMPMMQQQSTTSARQTVGGMYGRRNVHNPVKQPDVFNDD